MLHTDPQTDDLYRSSRLVAGVETTRTVADFRLSRLLEHRGGRHERFGQRRWRRANRAPSAPASAAGVVPKLVSSGKPARTPRDPPSAPHSLCRAVCVRRQAAAPVLRRPSADASSLLFLHVLHTFVSSGARQTPRPHLRPTFCRSSCSGSACALSVERSAPLSARPCAARRHRSLALWQALLPSADRPSSIAESIASFVLRRFIAAISRFCSCRPWIARAARRQRPRWSSVASLILFPCRPSIRSLLPSARRAACYERTYCEGVSRWHGIPVGIAWASRVWHLCGVGSDGCPPSPSLSCLALPERT